MRTCNDPRTLNPKHTIQFRVSSGCWALTFRRPRSQPMNPPKRYDLNNNIFFIKGRMSTHFYTYTSEHQTTPSNYTCWVKHETSSRRGIDLLFGFYFDFFRVFGETKMKEQARTPNEEAGNTATLKGGQGQWGGGVKCESVWLAGKPAPRQEGSHSGSSSAFGSQIFVRSNKKVTSWHVLNPFLQSEQATPGSGRENIKWDMMMKSIPTPMFVLETPPFYEFGKKSEERERDAQLKWQSELKVNRKGSYCYFYIQVRMWSGN